MAQNPAISLPQPSQSVALQPSLDAISIEPVMFQTGASGCFLRVLWVLGFFVLLILVVYGTQWLFAAAGGF